MMLRLCIWRSRDNPSGKRQRKQISLEVKELNFITLIRKDANFRLPDVTETHNVSFNKSRSIDEITEIKLELDCKQLYV